MRRTPLPSLSLASALLGTGCIEDLVRQGTELAPDSDTSDETTSTSEPLTPTSTSGPDLQTSADTVESTGAVDMTGTSTAALDMGSPADAPPKVLQFDGLPDHIGEAGTVALNLLASADVVAVQLSLDKQVLEEALTPADFPRKHAFLSAKDNGTRIFKVVVEDDEGLTAEASAKVEVLLPVSGAEKCLFEDPGRGSVISVVTAVEYTAEAIVAVGSRDTGAGPRLTVWWLDPDTCALDGGPRTISNWSVDPNLEGLTSVGAAVDVDEHGNLVVAGNFIVGGKPRSYAALLNAGGSLLWEHAGLIGDEVMGVAAGIGEFSDRIFVVGSQRTSDVPVRTDGAIWMYETIGNDVFVAAPKILAAPFTDAEVEQDPVHVLSEWVRAVVIEPKTGNALAVGEREFKSDAIEPYSRAFAVRVDPFGAVIGAPWTSPADSGFLNDAARSLAVCGDGFVAGGWTRDKPVGAPPQPMIFWIGSDGSAVQQRPELGLSPSQTHGIACDREGKIVSAGTRTAGPPDAQVFMVEGPQGPRAVYEPGVPGNDGAGAVACDARGFCGWGGYRTDGGKPYAVVRVHHP